jgi:hypothetical protein
MKKADNFDSSKWLTENKITTQSKLNENWLPYKDMSDEEYYESFKKFVISTLKQHKVIDEHIEIYLDEVLKKGNIKEYEGISDKDLYEDFLEVKNDQIEQDEDLFDFDF